VTALRIAARFNGPPGSGNGGYCAGLFAGAFDGASGGASGGAPGAAFDGAFGGAFEGAEVTLRLPPPLETPLSTVDGRVYAPDGALVAEVTAGAPVDVAVPPVPHADAVRAASGYRGFAGHPFGSCYVCGPDRDDGLAIFPGLLPDGTTAAPWTVPADVSVPTVWAALDCPGGWTVLGPGRACVLGRITVRMKELPEPGEECVVRGALVATQGRKSSVHTTLYGADGAELARARATWIEIDL